MCADIINVSEPLAIPEYFDGKAPEICKSFIITKKQMCKVGCQAALMELESTLAIFGTPED